ncbi:sulfotransferase family protein [Salinibacter ruber]|uniref:sulfotransferase family protein n=1 Tax=Salinibacter ruber TaxID=146919 RepID=UPI0021D47DA8|nr:sulfotransferase [Salinibacter ruber]
MSASRRPLFIVGCDRSGTTLLRLMITNNPQFHILHETGFLHILKDRSDVYGSFTAPRERWYFIRDLQTHRATSETYSFSAFGLTEQEAETALAKAAPVDFTGAAGVLFEASALKRGATRWGDKTPHYVLHVSWLAESYPDAQFLHIVRDGRDVASSIRRAGWEKSLRSAAQTWRTRAGGGHEAGSSLSEKRYREVQYESLVTSPEKTLRSLCKWLDLSYSSEMLNFHEHSDSHLPDAHEDLYEKTHKPIDPSRAQAWKNTLSSREIADIEEVASDLLSEFDYKLTNARVPLWLRGLRGLHRNTLSYTKSLVETLRRLGIA